MWSDFWCKHSRLKGLVLEDMLAINLFFSYRVKAVNTKIKLLFIRFFRKITFYRYVKFTYINNTSVDSACKNQLWTCFLSLYKCLIFHFIVIKIITEYFNIFYIFLLNLSQWMAIHNKGNPYYRNILDKYCHGQLRDKIMYA